MTKQAAFHQQTKMALPFYHYPPKPSDKVETRLFNVDIVERCDGEVLVFVSNIYGEPVSDPRTVEAAREKAKFI